jgi:hypothetical protein
MPPRGPSRPGEPRNLNIHATLRVPGTGIMAERFGYYFSSGASGGNVLLAFGAE